MKSSLFTARWVIVQALFGLCGATALAGVIRVDSRAQGTNAGGSWNDAFVTLQDALADANSMEKPVEVWVAEGTYRPDQGSGVKAGDTKATFRLINGVTIRGGYAGLGQPDPNARDINVYSTILSGDLAGDDASTDDLCDLPGAIKGLNSCAVVWASGTNETAVLDGFTVTGSAVHTVDRRIDLNSTVPTPSPVKVGVGQRFAIIRAVATCLIFAPLVLLGRGFLGPRGCF